MNTQTYTSDIGESYIKAVMPNGLRVYICEKPQYRSAYAIFGTKYGSIDTAFQVNGEAVEVPEGIAHFLEHKLFESEEVDAFTKYAETGAYANAFTSFDRTCYLFSCSDRFYENLKILLDFVQSPYFTEQTVQKEQGIIGQEIRMYDDSPAWRVMFNMLACMYEKHPVRIDIAGTVESISHITADLLYKCYRTFYDPSNMFLCIAGNVDSQTALRLIEEASAPGSGRIVERRGVSEPDSVCQHEITQSLEVAQPMFCLGYKLPGENVSLEQKVETALLLETLAGDSSPLYERLIRQGLINDGFSFELFTGSGYAAVMFEGESDDPWAVRTAIEEELARVKRDGLDPALFAAVKKGIYGGCIRRFNNVEGIAMQLVECAMDDTELFREIELLRGADIESVQRRIPALRPDRSVLSVICPKGRDET